MRLIDFVYHSTLSLRVMKKKKSRTLLEADRFLFLTSPVCTWPMCTLQFLQFFLGIGAVPPGFGVGMCPTLAHVGSFGEVFNLNGNGPVNGFPTLAKFGWGLCNRHPVYYERIGFQNNSDQIAGRIKVRQAAALGVLAFRGTSLQSGTTSVFSVPLVCTGSGRNPATRGTHQAARKRRLGPALRAGGRYPRDCKS